MLSHIKKILIEEGIPGTLEEATPEIPHARLLIYLGNDSHKRERILTLTAQEQLLSFGSKKLPEEERYTRIQFQVSFPFKVQEHTLHDVSSVLHFINRLLDLPGLELNELDNQVLYRYVLLIPSNALTKTLLLSIVGTVMMFVDLFSETIEQIGDGSRTFNELLEEIVATANKITNQ